MYNMYMYVHVPVCIPYKKKLGEEYSCVPFAIWNINK